MRRFELALPDTLAACQQALADGPDAKLVAGGPDLLPQYVDGAATSAVAGSVSHRSFQAPAAIANAIEDATGLRLVELPLTPERIALGLAARERVNGSG